MRYYYGEHEAGYRRLRQAGMTQWSDLFGETETFDAFPNRGFLEEVLGRLDLGSPAEVDVLEYGCGTGPAACFLAARGFRVDAVDLIPEAIELARRFAQERGVEVTFGVQDICVLADEPVRKRYDLIVDSYCLQSIVTDADRARVFAAVRARLKDNGYYLVSTAMYEPERSYEDGFRYDEETGICYQESGTGPDAVEIDGVWYVPHRRHLSSTALRAELERAELKVVSQEDGNLVCTRSS
ncbi:class I SAM-dependent methyltransferase [Kribbella pittospori]|uniref:Class I SAM-dependent methyltransferase n=1 Tax=Kribbella pittospori TaxID=722689 RepID=A0A4R0KIB3_9ACTN|nr:class I SAM-dependent methyltransferase [Kribbella pittospori]TCC59427.1 class I SAM-dependent methyltransferase [Kribbella pittospori]